MEEQLDFFEEPSLNYPEVMLALQKQIMDLTNVVAQQHGVMEDMAKLIQKQQGDVGMLMSDKYRNDSKIAQFETDIRRLDQENYIKDQWGSYSNKRAPAAVEEIYSSVVQIKNSSLPETLFAIFEIFKLLMDQFPESQKAEIISKMASSRDSKIPSYTPPGVYVDYSRILREAALILNQPESILTLYK